MNHWLFAKVFRHHTYVLAIRMVFENHLSFMDARFMGEIRQTLKIHVYVATACVHVHAHMHMHTHTCTYTEICTHMLIHT